MEPAKVSQQRFNLLGTLKQAGLQYICSPQLFRLGVFSWPATLASSWFITVNVDYFDIKPRPQATKRSPMIIYFKAMQPKFSSVL